MVEWRSQLPDMETALLPGAVLYAGKRLHDDEMWVKQLYFWEVTPRAEDLPSAWGYCATIEEAKALALANYVMRKP